MIGIEKAGNGECYLAKLSPKKKVIQNWFLIREGDRKTGFITMKTDIRFPKEFIGKKIRLRVEVIE